MTKSSNIVYLFSGICIGSIVLGAASLGLGLGLENFANNRLNGFTVIGLMSLGATALLTSSLCGFICCALYQVIGLENGSDRDVPLPGSTDFTTTCTILPLSPASDQREAIVV